MTRAGCRRWFAHLLALIALLAPVTAARADDDEVREYSVLVDGKNAGLSRLKIVQTSDGVTYIVGSLDIRFRHLLVVNYALKIDSQEWWKAGKLIGMKTAVNDNGKRSEITVAADNGRLRMRVDGQDRVLKADVWTNSYWKLADARFYNKQVPILEVDSGKEFECDLKYLETTKLKVGSDFKDCYHFRVAAAPGPVDLWFDKYHRLVRQEFVESGHKTIVQLVKVVR